MEERLEECIHQLAETLAPLEYNLESHHEPPAHKWLLAFGHGLWPRVEVRIAQTGRVIEIRIQPEECPASSAVRIGAWMAQVGELAQVLEKELLAQVRL